MWRPCEAMSGVVTHYTGVHLFTPIRGSEDDAEVERCTLIPG